MVLPALMQLLVPALRPVAAHLQSVDERDGLAALVDTMLAYNLRYEGGGGGAAAAAFGAAPAATPLQPAVDKLCAFQVRA